MRFHRYNFVADNILNCLNCCFVYCCVIVYFMWLCTVCTNKHNNNNNNKGMKKLRTIRTYWTCRVFRVLVLHDQWRHRLILAWVEAFYNRLGVCYFRCRFITYLRIAPGKTIPAWPPRRLKQEWRLRRFAFLDAYQSRHTYTQSVIKSVYHSN